MGYSFDPFCPLPPVRVLTSPSSDTDYLSGLTCVLALVEWCDSDGANVLANDGRSRVLRQISERNIVSGGPNGG